MRGLELARAYYEQFGRPMLDKQFSELLPHIAVGLFGSGSECFGYDDDVSRDHDFEPGFMLLLPGEDVVSRRDAFLLERAYAKLPREFMGLRRSLMQPVGGPRHGVMRTADFFMEKVGSPDGVLTVGQWLSTPEYALAEAVNGAWQPYYKWAFRALRALPELSLLAELMEYLITTGNDGDAAREKREVMEGMAADIIAGLKTQGLTKAECGDLEQHAFSVNDGIGDAEIRNLHIMAAL